MGGRDALIYSNHMDIYKPHPCFSNLDSRFFRDFQTPLPPLDERSYMNNPKEIFKELYIAELFFIHKLLTYQGEYCIV